MATTPYLYFAFLVVFDIETENVCPTMIFNVVSTGSVKSYQTQRIGTTVSVVVVPLLASAVSATLEVEHDFLAYLGCFLYFGNSTKSRLLTEG